MSKAPLLWLEIMRFADSTTHARPLPPVSDHAIGDLRVTIHATGSTKPAGTMIIYRDNWPVAVLDAHGGIVGTATEDELIATVQRAAAANANETPF